jgi:hypothetical protein
VEPGFVRALEQLRSTETSLRFHQVEEAYRDTYEWLFTDQSLGFGSWLESDLPLYWIKGKPASGKSTLMKFAVDDERTFNAFKKEPAKSTIAAFFFHDRGSYLQKSLEGLLREILHTLISDIPELTPLFLNVYKKHRWLGNANNAEFHWLPEATKQLFSDILKQNIVDISVLLFLDALDEYSGSHSDIALWLLGWKGSNKTKIKICFSSRPEQVFLDKFHALPGFSIHDHTRGDIEKVIKSEFLSNDRIQRTLEENNDHDRRQIIELRTRIADLAQGVFLWVRLILDELLTEYTNGANFQELQALLSSVPRELDKYYEHIVRKRLDPKYVEERDLMFEILRCAARPLTVKEFFVALQLVPVQQLKSFRVDMPSLDEATRRINSRCGALIEVQEDFQSNDTQDLLSPTSKYLDIDGSDPELTRRRVQFLHQTVKTWSSKASADLTEAHSGDGHLYLLKMFAYATLLPGGAILRADFPILVDLFSKAELNVESSLPILRQAPVFTIRIVYRKYAPDNAEYSLKQLAFLAGTPKLLAKLLSMYPGEGHGLFREYCKVVARHDETRFSREVASMLLKQIPRPREREVWLPIAAFIQDSAIPRGNHHTAKLDSIAEDLCNLAIEEGLDPNSKVQPHADRFPVYPFLRDFDTGISPKYCTTILHLAMTIIYDRPGEQSLHYKITKLFINHGADPNILDQSNYSVLDLALGRVQREVPQDFPKDFPKDVQDDDGGSLDASCEACQLLFSNGARLSGQHPELMPDAEQRAICKKLGYDLDEIIASQPLQAPKAGNEQSQDGWMSRMFRLFPKG